ncbi:hypothetical protein HYX18_01520 [Candidatus Woesearchaeota archaeon]|nr:hypothetical protein [Candidatus Woesearchaeota archaeon]
MQNYFIKEKLDLFWWFVNERQSIWNKRFIEKLPYPWTSDKVLKEEHFTNVYRELDPGTLYVVKSILELNKPKPDKIFNNMIYRLIGREETFDFIGFQDLVSFNPKIFQSKLKDFRSSGKNVFTGAYLVSGYSNMGSKDKIENITKLFIKIHNNFDLFYNNIENSKTSEQVYTVIKSQDGFGNFLAYQVLVDLLYPLKCYQNKPLLPYSHNDWAIAGPGARKGIKLIIDGAVKISDLDVMKWLRSNQKNEFKRLDLKFPYLIKNKEKMEISLANIQNCLCEFYKYVKIKEGFGRGRRKFKTPFLVP